MNSTFEPFHTRNFTMAEMTASETARKKGIAKVRRQTCKCHSDSRYFLSANVTGSNTYYSQVNR